MHLSDVALLDDGAMAAVVATKILGLTSQFYVGQRHEGFKVYTYIWPDSVRRPFEPWVIANHVVMVIEAMLATDRRLKLTAYAPGKYVCSFPHFTDHSGRYSEFHGPLHRAVMGAALRVWEL